MDQNDLEKLDEWITAGMEKHPRANEIIIDNIFNLIEGLFENEVALDNNIPEEVNKALAALHSAINMKMYYKR